MSFAKMTRKEKRISLFVLLLLCISLGFAFLTQQLNINGIAQINKITWGIIWDNVEVEENSIKGTQVITPATIANSQKSLVEYSISLKEPGEYYEFTVDAKNEGSLDAMIDVFSNKVYESNGTTERQLPTYLT